MRSSSREEIVEGFDALKAAQKRVLDLTFDVLTTPERLTMLAHCEQIRRVLSAVEHPLINQLGGEDPAVVGGKLAPVLADRLRISRAEAARRIQEAADLGQRQTLTGEPLAPVLEATAAAQRNGDLGAGHVAVIRSRSASAAGRVPPNSAGSAWAASWLISACSTAGCWRRSCSHRCNIRSRSGVVSVSNVRSRARL